MKNKNFSKNKIEITGLAGLTLILLIFGYLGLIPKYIGWLLLITIVITYVLKGTPGYIGKLKIIP